MSRPARPSPRTRSPLHDDVPGNLAFEYEYGNRASRRRGFADGRACRARRRARAAHRRQSDGAEILRRRPTMRPATSFELCAPSQGTARSAKPRWRSITGLAAERFRIHSADVGGGFGVRNEVYPEFLARDAGGAKNRTRREMDRHPFGDTVRRSSRPRRRSVRRTRRSTSDGRFVALRVEWLVNLGAFCSNAGPLINTVAAPTSSAISLYDSPRFTAGIGWSSPTRRRPPPIAAPAVPMSPICGNAWSKKRRGDRHRRPSNFAAAIFCARTCSRCKTPTGSNYDSADPERLLKTALQAADWKGFGSGGARVEARTASCAASGSRCFSSRPAAWARSRSKSASSPTASWRCTRNAGPSGQGHETVFPALVADVLGMPDGAHRAALQRCRRRRNWLGTGIVRLALADQPRRCAARPRPRKSSRRAASSRRANSRSRRATSRSTTAHYKVAGTDLKISLQSLIERKWGAADASARHQHSPSISPRAFPSGAHVAEVEIDPDTGELAVLNYIAADDCGTIYNHKLVEGQLHGGLMQGIGQVIGEQIAYDPRPASSCPAASWIISCRAPRMRADRADRLRCASPANPLGAKGAGEAGATGSVPALANAVLDALKARNVRQLEMPYTPDRIWRAIQAAQGAKNGGKITALTAAR